jgi:hypothetical protein
VVLYLKYISSGIPAIFSGSLKEPPHHGRGAPIFTKSINTEANYLICNRISLNFRILLGDIRVIDNVGPKPP